MIKFSGFSYVSLPWPVGCLLLQVNLFICISTDPCVTGMLGAKGCLFLWREHVSVVQYLLGLFEDLSLIPCTEEKSEWSIYMWRFAISLSLKSLPQMQNLVPLYWLFIMFPVMHLQLTRRFICPIFILEVPEAPSKARLHFPDSTFFHIIPSRFTEVPVVFDLRGNSETQSSDGPSASSFFSSPLATPISTSTSIEHSSQQAIGRPILKKILCSSWQSLKERI